MPKFYNGRSRRKFRSNRVMIQSLVRGYLGRIRAREARDRREITNFIVAGRRRAARIHERDPVEHWLRQSAGAGGRPMAAGGGGSSNPLPYAGGTARAQDDLPGHANMRRAYDEHVDSLRGRQNQNPHWIGTRTNHRDPNITQLSMENFMQRNGGPTNIDPRTGLPLRRDAEGRGVTNWNFLGDYKH